MKNKILNMLGLAKRAGRIKSGSFSVETAVKALDARLVILAEDASPGSQKLITDKAAYRKIPVLVWGTKAELGKAIGQAERSCLALTDEGFARRTAEMIEEERTRKTEGGD